jgi:hypothetical protein
LSKVIESNRLSVTGYGEFINSDIARIKQETKLTSAYVQQARDQALWMWRSYYAQHSEWVYQLKKAKGNWHEKLLT